MTNTKFYAIADGCSRLWVRLSRPFLDTSILSMLRTPRRTDQSTVGARSTISIQTTRTVQRHPGDLAHGTSTCRELCTKNLSQADGCVLRDFFVGQSLRLVPCTPSRRAYYFSISSLRFITNRSSISLPFARRVLYESFPYWSEALTFSSTSSIASASSSNLCPRFAFRSFKVLLI